MTPVDVLARARACLGIRFRPHGRLPAHGLDCVGLVVHAYALDGVPGGYALRGGDLATISADIARFGFIETDGLRAADLLLLQTGPFQFHLAIATGGGFVHADAGLRRVVETPGDPRWPLVSRFRKARAVFGGAESLRIHTSSVF